jgi:hypothetical protein
MERCFAEKAKVVADLRVKYEMKIRESEARTDIGEMVRL